MKNIWKNRGRYPRVVFRHGVEFIVLVVIFGCGGCNGDSNKVQTFPVRGKVLVDGKPAGNAKLVFHPVARDERLQRLSPRATADEDGYFELKTYWSGDGAPIGEYTITASWRGPLPANAGSDDFSVTAYEAQQDRLKGRYDDPAKTPLRVIIQGACELPPLELTAK